jgi:SAM-dependent methyltransferase
MLKALASAWRRHGPLRFCYLLVYNAYYYARSLGRGSAPDPAELAFDREHGVDTATIREIGSLAIDSPNARHAVRYQPSDLDLARQVLAQLEIAFPRFTFVDYGCGKGMVLLLAAEFPFNRIIGVEFAPELVAIARRNIAHYRGDLLCRDIEVVQADAAEFPPPPGPLVCYFYNPFGEPVMRQVVNRLEDRLRQDPAELFVIYLNPRHERVFNGSSLWKASERTDWSVVIRRRAPDDSMRPTEPSQCN